MENTYIGQAKAVYQNGNKDARDLEKRVTQVFTKAEHEDKVGFFSFVRDTSFFQQKFLWRFG